MIEPIGWGIIAGSLTAGVGTGWLVWFLYRHREGAAPRWFAASLLSQALWISAYTTGLFVQDPFWRATAEALTWVGIAWLGPLFLGFTLVYTGRGAIAQSWSFRALFAIPVATTLLALTHPAHTLLWRGFRFVPAFGLETVQYTVQPWAALTAVFSLVTAGAGVLLLVETILSYGPLYRREALAVGASTVAPATAFVVWLLEVGPVPMLNLAPLLFLPHVVLDGYAFADAHMFDTSPTTQRAAERSALRDLEDPLLVVDAGERVINLNERARAAFGATGSPPFPLAELVGTDLASLRARGEYRPQGWSERVYGVSCTELSDPTADHVGAILVFYDITDERRRKQRLSVLSRVLRHNVSNKLTVTQGRARLIESKTDDPEIEGHVRSLIEANDELLSITNNVRAFGKIQARDRRPTTVDPVATVEAVVADVADDYPDAAFDVTDELEARRLETDVETLELVIRNLVANAVQHADSPTPTAEVRISEGPADKVVIEVRDRNRRIPETEIETLRSDTESSLQHGQGTGLWVSRWCVDLLNGELSFSYQAGNVVRISLPRQLAD